MEGNEARNDGHGDCYEQDITHNLLYAHQQALHLERRIKPVHGQLRRLCGAVSLRRRLLQGGGVLLGCERVLEGQVLRQPGHVVQLGTVEQVVEERRPEGRTQHRTAGDQEEGVVDHQFRIEFLDDIDSECDEENHHAHSAQGHRQEQHFVASRCRDPEIDDGQAERKAEQAPADQVAEPPSLPPQPPETDERSAGESRQHPQVDRVGVYAVDAQYRGQVGGHQRTGRREEHDEDHEPIADQRLGAVEQFQVQVGIFAEGLPAEEEPEQQEGRDGRQGNSRRRESVEGLEIGGGIEHHEQGGRSEQDAPAVDFAEGDFDSFLPVAEQREDAQDGDQQQQDDEVVHILPLVAVGQFGRQVHRDLSGGKDDRVEVGVKFASDIRRAEKGADHDDDLQHREGFEESDQEAAHDHHLHLSGAGADETQEHLHQQVDEQDGFGRDDRSDFRHERVGHGHADRRGVIGHADVLAQDTERIGDLGDAPRIGSVDEDDRQHDDKGRRDGQPPGDPGPYGDAQRLLQGHRITLFRPR